jgi:hypothetical protein
MQKKTYKSSLKKLVRFFEQSRDNWKNKYFEKNKELKRATNRIYDLEMRKDKWKKRALEAENKIKEMDEDLLKKKLL